MNFQSIFGTLNWMDLGKGLIMVVLGFILTGTYEALQAGTILWTWAFFKPIVLGGAAAGLAYLIKNFFTNSSGEPLTTEKK
jgi:hypothetical protein